VSTIIIISKPPPPPPGPLSLAPEPDTHWRIRHADYLAAKMALGKAFQEGDTISMEIRED
jgi:hypothetical protein